MVDNARRVWVVVGIALYCSPVSSITRGHYIQMNSRGEKEEGSHHLDNRKSGGRDYWTIESSSSRPPMQRTWDEIPNNNKREQKMDVKKKIDSRLPVFLIVCWGSHPTTNIPGKWKGGKKEAITFPSSILAQSNISITQQQLLAGMVYSTNMKEIPRLFSLLPFTTCVYTV
jgi:hypothetical protein